MNPTPKTDAEIISLVWQAYNLGFIAGQQNTGLGCSIRNSRALESYDAYIRRGSDVTCLLLGAPPHAER